MKALRACGLIMASLLCLSSCRVEPETVLSADSQQPAVPLASSLRPMAALPRGAYAAVACTRTTAETDKRFIKSRDPRMTSGQELVCIDSSSPVSLDINHMRIRAISSEEAYVNVACKGDDQYRKAIERGGDFGGLIIGTNEGVIARFNYLRSADVINKCGAFPLNDLERALLLCKDLRVAGGADSNACLDICEKSSQGVCTEVVGR